MDVLHLIHVRYLPDATTRCGEHYSAVRSFTKGIDIERNDLTRTNFVELTEFTLHLDVYAIACAYVKKIVSVLNDAGNVVAHQSILRTKPQECISVISIESVFCRYPYKAHFVLIDLIDIAAAQILTHIIESTELRKERCRHEKCQHQDEEKLYISTISIHSFVG